MGRWACGVGVLHHARSGACDDVNVLVDGAAIRRPRVSLCAVEFTFCVRWRTDRHALDMDDAFSLML